VLWQYMAGSTTSRFATREYAYADITFVITEIKGRFALICCPPSNRLVHFYTHGEGIYHIYSSAPKAYWVDPTSTQAGYTNPHQDTTNSVDDHPSAVYTQNGRLRLFWVRSGSIYSKYSDNMGEDYSEPVEVLSGYERAFLWSAQNIEMARINLVGIKSSGVCEYAWSGDGATTFSTPVVVSSDVDVIQPSGLTMPNGTLVVVARSGVDYILHKSVDGGNTWQIVS